MRSPCYGVLTWGLVTITQCLSSSDWRKQSIYQVMTDRFARTDLSTTASCDASQGVYCGGTYKGLVSKLDYIQGMGFTAIWISPIVKQMDGQTLDGSSYHGYWAEDIWGVNSAFGSADDLVALSDALHEREMYLMLDVVTNHMAYRGCGECVDYSKFDPFSSSSYFHSLCLIDYNNETSIQQCWEGDNIVSLPDLRTEDANVRSIWNDWIKEIVSKYKIDGLRIDSAKHQEKSFWPGFEDAAGVHIVGEVFNGDPAYVAPFQDYMSGILDYPSYYWITQAFQSSSGSMTSLADGVNRLKSIARDTSLYGSFMENHDQKRFLSLTNDRTLAKNAIAFTMLKDGIPIIYQGQEQSYTGGDIPNSREAICLSGYATDSEPYTWIPSLNKIRSWAIHQDAKYLTYQAYPIYYDDNAIAMRKGFDGYQVIGVFTNAGSGGSAGVNLTGSQTGFAAGEALVDVMSCTASAADASGGITATLEGGIPRVYYPADRLFGSGICSSLAGERSR
ncbi:glycoside hydrolase [Phialemonium atrogriseum]|uniref:alpha-amylase n=1 Tax=Phialemonium atrogriseum TaxID=1093897 RepID=A0AAJ0FIT9_9PEZI|nr:glycoside hydrolase [Phialemonium atrogriseum]KAK1769931.1 glycoside hydrolase [Phialemonium atrogriseum]